MDSTTLYEASQEIILNEGFEVSQDAGFIAQIVNAPVYQEDWQYEWTITDHLGNLRMVYSDLNCNGDINGKAEILQEVQYYPFGMRWEDGTTDYTDRFRYLSKGHELQTGLGLNYRRTLNRFYDSGAGIWLSVDPLQNAPENIRFSSYASMWLNPVKYSDENGDCPACGAIVGSIDNILGTRFRDKVSFSNDETQKGFNRGINNADRTFLVGGAMMMASGGGKMTGGAALATASLAEPTPFGEAAGGAAAVTGFLEAAAGAWLANNASKNLMSSDDSTTADDSPNYENPGHHDPTGGGPNTYNKSKSVLPDNHTELWNNSSLANDGNRYTKAGHGKKAVYHRFQNDGNGNWHWNGSTNGVTSSGESRAIKTDNIPIEIRRQ